MSCSTDIGLQALKKLEDNIKGQLAGLTAGAGGLTTNLSTLQSKVNLAKDVSTALTTALPSLEGMIPSRTLIGDMGALIAAKDNPQQFAAQLLTISQNYVDVPGVDVQALATSILTGQISPSNICAQIPNVIVNKAGEIIKKGVPPIPPTTNVKELISTTKKASSVLQKKLPMISNITNIDIKSKVESFSATQAPQTLGKAKDITNILPLENVKSMSSELTTATSKMGTFTQKLPIGSSPLMISNIDEAKATLLAAKAAGPTDKFMMQQEASLKASFDSLGEPIPGAVYEDIDQPEDIG